MLRAAKLSTRTLGSSKPVFVRALSTQVVKSDFVVIGSGIAGSSAAFNLAKSGKGRVTVLEREEQHGYHSTGRSAALYAETYGSEVVRAITTGSKAEFQSEELVRLGGGVPFLKDLGLLWIARPDQLAQLHELFKATGKLVNNLQYLQNAKQVHEACSLVKTDYATAGFLEPDARDMDVNAIHSAFLRGTKLHGGEVHNGAEVVQIERTSTKNWVVHTAKGEKFEAPVLVNAAGAWADQIALLAGIRPIGLLPKRRTCINFECPAQHLSALHSMPMVFDVGEEFYFKPDAGRFLASPADETPMLPTDAQPDEFDVAFCVDRVQQATGMNIRTITNKWAGLRSFVPDKDFVLGPDDREASFVWAAGQGGFGIQTAPAAGRLVKAFACGEEVPQDLADLGVTKQALSPSRLLDRQAVSSEEVEVMVEKLMEEFASKHAEM